jgi:hypothetical protein
MGSPPEPQEETMSAYLGRRPQRAALAAVALSLGLVASACTGLLDSGDTKAGLSCIDDSRECVDQRQATLKSFLADKDRTWVKEPATAQAHASGVRLFAFRSKKRELSCEELAHGRREADAAAMTLRGPDGKSLSPAQVSRATLFAAEVSKELTAEMRARRCKVA